LGANLLYSDITSSIETGNIIPSDWLTKDLKSTALAAVAEYDTRNTIFTPDSGLYGKLVAQRYSENIGSDFDAWNLRAKVFSFTPITEKFVLGLRAEAESIDGDAPYYMYPSVNIRGIANGRYQGQYATVVETEGRYAVNNRWSLIGFVGTGKAFGENSSGQDSSFSQADWNTAGGVGFRYKIAKKFGLHIGLDYAIGPEENSIYITGGQAWNAFF
jgi:outer membrane protein assembly factor BamA